MTNKRGDFGVVLLCGAVYAVVGLVFGELAGTSASATTRFAWRWAAWIVSAVTFGAHLGYEHLVRQRAPRRVAWYVALAAALGAFGLAAGANVHNWQSPTRAHSQMLVVSLLIWPVITLVPAFIVAFLGSLMLERIIGRHNPRKSSSLDQG